MTEEEWLRRDDAELMYRHLRRRRWVALGLSRHRPGARKLRLLAAATFRRLRISELGQWRILHEALRCRWDDAVIAAEQLADGLPMDATFADCVVALPDPEYGVRAALSFVSLVGIADLFRDIFGNPFRPVAFSPDWLTSTVLALASQMYDSRDFSAMPILADALQDAGCDNADILDHCRGPGPHVRGCWVVDLVLGKE